MNLTRVQDDPAEAIDRNYLDSVAPLAFDLIPENSSLVDVGSGAGFPGMPLAILRADVSVTLMDSIGKRVEFLRDAAEALSLNVRALCLRAEDAGAGRTCANHSTWRPRAPSRSFPYFLNSRCLFSRWADG